MNRSVLGCAVAKFCKKLEAVEATRDVGCWRERDFVRADLSKSKLEEGTNDEKIAKNSDVRKAVVAASGEDELRAGDAGVLGLSAGSLSGPSRATGDGHDCVLGDGYAGEGDGVLLDNADASIRAAAGYHARVGAQDLGDGRVYLCLGCRYGSADAWHVSIDADCGTVWHTEYR